jgi:hypothetical protein
VVFAVDGNQMTGELPGWLLSGILGCYVDQYCNGLFDLSGDNNTFYCPTADTIKGEEIRGASWRAPGPATTALHCATLHCAAGQPVPWVGECTHVPASPSLPPRARPATPPNMHAAA